MFDNETVPKYIIGRGHEIIPVNPSTTDVLVNECTLEPMGVSYYFK
jgi:predicted CoA-binding protein